MPINIDPVDWENYENDDFRVSAPNEGRDISAEEFLERFNEIGSHRETWRKALISMEG